MDFDAIMQQALSGPSEADKQRALAQALAAAGFGILGARTGGGWRGALNAVGQGGLLGQQVYSNQMSDAQQNKRQGLLDATHVYGLKRQYEADQRADQQRQALEAARAASVIPGAPGSPEMGPPTATGQMQPATPPGPPGFDYAGYANRIATVDPGQSMQILGAMQKENPWDKINPKDYTPESLKLFAASRNPADLVAKAAPDQGPLGKINPSDFTPTSVAKFMRSGDYSVLVPIDKRPQTNVNVLSESEEAKAIGKSRGETYANLMKAGQESGQKMARLDAIQNLLNGVDTNALTPVGMKFAGYAKAAGINVDPKLPAKQAAEAISNELALQVRNPASGAGMPGAMSDADREFLKNTVPNLSQTPEGRAKLIEVQRRMARREAEVAALARQYRARNGTFDEGFQEVLSQFSKERPLFADLQDAPSPKVIDFHSLPK